MELPILKEARRIDETGPKIFLWEREGKPDTGVYRPRISFTFARKSEGAVALILEQAEYRQQKRFYVPLFEQFKDDGELLDRVGELRKQWEVENIYSRLTKIELDFLSFYNMKEKHRFHLHATPPPNVNDQGKFSFHLGTMRELMRPGRVRLDLHEAIPTLLSTLGDFTADISDMDYPAMSAVAYGVSAVYTYETIEEQKKKKPWDPWAVLRDDNKYNPIGPNDPVMNGDPFKGM